MWLIESTAFETLKQAQSMSLKPSTEQQAAFEARLSAHAKGDSRLLTVTNGVADIAISGVITNTPNLLAMLFGAGNVTYQDIVTALDAADRNDSVKQIQLSIDSPGGTFDGLFDALAAIQLINKPTKAIVKNLAASAAFAIASQADEIVASSIASRVGSVGVVATFATNDNEISITSTDSPKKRPDITTQEGINIVKEELDAMHDIFVDSIAIGRKVSPETVNKEFGKGATVLAKEALQRGMIDSIVESKSNNVTPHTFSSTIAQRAQKPEATSMDLKTLQAEYPSIFSAAKEIGITEERDRVTAHILMGKASGDMETACTAIENGSCMTATLQATYMAAGLNNRDIANRLQDDREANAGDGAIASERQGDVACDVASLVELELGLGA